MKKYLIIVLLTLIIIVSFSYDANLFVDFQSKHDDITTNLGLGLGLGGSIEHENFGLKGRFSFKNFHIGDVNPVFGNADATWGPFDDFYYQLDQGNFWYSSDDLYFSLGYHYLDEGVGRNYPLFLASNSGAYPSIVFEWQPFDVFGFKTDLVFLKTGIDWVPYVDTEGNLTKTLEQTAKTLYFRRAKLSLIEDLEFGYVESVLFFGRSLDFPYLFSPAPYQTIQEFRSFNAPWHDNKNDNGMMGLYFVYEPDPIRVFGEVLIDDFYMNIAEKTFDGKGHPQKVAWDTGIEYKVNESLLCFLEFAGATKYTFKRTNLVPYEYVHYNTDEEKLPIEYNMLGYKYGENSASFILGTEYVRDDFEMDGSFEFVTFGKRAPWIASHGTEGEGKDDMGFVWLSDPVLEQQYKFNFSTSFPSVWDTHIKLSATLGKIVNKDLFEGVNEDILNFSLEVKKNFSMNDFIETELIRKGQ